jgi:outer membrane lipoprotein-sorting protein
MLKWSFTQYVKLESYIKQYLPIEESVYVIDNNKTTRNVTIPYYLCLFINKFFIGTNSTYLINYRHQKKKKIVSNGNFLSIVNQVRSNKQTHAQLKVPVYGLIIRANDKLLGAEEKKTMLMHDRNDNFALLYELYFGESLTTLEVVYKGKTRTWKLSECATVKMSDIM